MYRLATIGLLLAFSIACNTTPQRPQKEAERVADTAAKEQMVDCDSLIKALDARYNELCEERKRAYSEADSARRATLLETNDREAQALNDTLQWALRMR